jgi:hypothetical protein
MVIHIKLSDRRTADSDDPLGRTWYGYDPMATPAELWENNRGDWNLSAESIAEQRWAALNYGGQVVLVVELEDPAFQVLPGASRPKKALRGSVLPKDHPVHEALSRKTVVYPPGTRNSIRYETSPDVDGLVEAGSPAAMFETRDRPGAVGQGLQMDPEVRKAIEDAAQDRLMNHYRDLGWTVTDTRQNRPYDAVADNGTERIYLEAKGTQSQGDSVIVTPNEVQHARRHPGACVMGVWSGMSVVDGVVDRKAGDFRILPFRPEDQDLRPRDFDWMLPGAPV